MDVAEAPEDAVQPEGGVYTRGRPGDEDKRGSSMVQKHFEKLQQEKEESALAKLQSLMPQLGTIVRSLALKETEWNVDKAALLLRRFQVSNASKLTILQKKRKKILADLASRGQSKEEAGRSSGLSSASSDSSPRLKSKRYRSKSPAGGRKSKKRKKNHKTRSQKKDKIHRSSEQDKLQARKVDANVKETKNRKRREKDKDGSNLNYEFGKFGVIRESDWQSKRVEFVMWAGEVKGIDAEQIPRTEEKELFKDYIEDYNTGTLPHRKYYDVEMYDRQKLQSAAKRSKGRERRNKERLTFNDEEEKRHEMARERVKQQEDRVREAYEEMMYGAKAEDMREQELLRMQMALAYKTGDTKTVEKLADRLRPDDGKETKKTMDK